MGAKKNLAHADDEVIERYAMGKLEGPDLEVFEEHLLACSQCQDRLTQFDQFIQALRKAAPRVGEKVPWRRRWTASPFRPALAAGIVFAVALIVAIPLTRRAGPSRYEIVELAALRGTDSQQTAKAGAPLQLRLDAAGMPVASAYTVEVVDERGRQIWQGSGQNTGGKIEVRMGERLESGRYWVRVYTSSLKTELIREYSLQAQ